MIESLPRREREVFELLCRLEEATASGVRGAMTDPLSDSAVRTLLGRLEVKGLVSHRTENQAYVYTPAIRPASVMESALHKIVQTFFHGSATNAATALLGLEKSIKPEEFEALQRAIDQARERNNDR